MYKEFWDLFIKGYGAVRASSLMAVVTVVLSVLEGVNAGLLVPLLESLDPSKTTDKHWISSTLASLFDLIGLPFNLETILLAMGLIVIALGLVKYFKFYLISRLGLGFTAWMRSRTMNSLLEADVAYFHREKIGELADGLTTQASRGSASFFHVTEIFSGIGMVAAYLAVAFLIAPVLTGVAVTMLIVVTIMIQYHVVKARKIGAQMVQRNRELHSVALEDLSGIRVIKSFALEKVRRLGFESTAASVAAEEHHLNMNTNQGTFIQETAIFGLIGGIVYVGVAILGLDIAVVVSLLFILYRMSPRVATINTRRQSMAAAMEALKSINTTIDETSQATSVSGNVADVELVTEIKLRDVGFSYNGGPPVLQHTNLIVEKGKMTALVGTSGSGKSTLVDLLLRYYDPVEGNILVDGVDIKELDLSSWRTSIGVVSQDVFLFHDTVANNISLGRVGFDQSSIEESAKQAYAHEFILQLPMGYETEIGDRGWNLSGGQRQRIALARAILTKPPILILDEATSSLDSESERLIQEYVEGIRGSCTIFVIAHRLATIQKADTIAVLENGQITEQGDWSSLIEKSGSFANYHRLQSGMSSD